ncbi:DUF6531 domain-containing protein [Actinoplanes sp. NBRC 103695]|uniref:DUF6531 domain-containing protein n=1 Tax=Actinoplanes sp. NBRC 103695 TaxID=3032202 RepID=UPI002552D859|nr:DUF6531 domain-containing protein [Actinoplanes sp. NBRC 103695]
MAYRPDRSSRPGEFPGERPVFLRGGRPGDPFHVLTVTRTADGRIRFTDPQSRDEKVIPPFGPEGTVVFVDLSTPGTTTQAPGDGSTDTTSDNDASLSSFLEGPDTTGDINVETGPAAITRTSPAAFSDVAPAAVAKSTVETPTVGDPIDVTTGRMILTETDVTLPGLTLERTYRSDYRWGRSFGRSWASTLDQVIAVDGAQVRYLAADGSVLTYPLPAEGTTVVPEVGRALPLRRLTEGGWLLTDPVSGRMLLFAGSGGGESLLSDVVEGGIRWSVERDGDGTPTVLRSSAGATVEFSSSAGLVTKLWLPGPYGDLVAAAQFGFDQDLNLTEVVNSSGTPERFQYTDGRLVRWEDRNGEWYTYTYDEAGRCVSTDGKGGYLRYQFEYTHGRTVVTDSLGAVRSYELNDRFQVVAETDALGATTRSEWDAAYRLRSQTDALGRIMSYEYDAHGRPTATTRPDGSRSTTVYDEFGRAVSWTDFDGATRTREFGADGLLWSESDATGEVIRTEQLDGNSPGTPLRAGPAATIRNSAFQVTSMMTEDGPTRYEYDDLGRVVATESDAGYTRFGWTIEGDLAWRENPDGTIEEYVYDGEGNLVEAIDADGRRTLRKYGAFDLVTAVTDDNGARTSYGYDTELRLATITNTDGETWRYTYDPNGRLVEETDFAGRTQRYAYDAAGQVVEHTDADGEVTVYTYDLLGRVIERRTGEAVTTLEYDGSGRIVAAADADSQIRLEHDALGRVISETVNGQTVTTSFSERFSLVTARTRPSGAVTQWSYDESGRPTVLAAAGQRLDADRLTAEAGVAGRAAELEGEAASYTLDALGRPITRTDATGEWRLAWDHQDRLVAVITPTGDRWHYQYDAFGRRIAKQRRGRTGAVLEEIEFVWSGDLLIEQSQRKRGGQPITSTWEYHPKLAGPVAQIMDGTLIAVEPAATNPDVAGWAAGGRYHDPETGLQYDRSRYYDPATGRFLQRPTAPLPAV